MRILPRSNREANAHLLGLLLLAGCGWRLGAPPVAALSAGPVEGAAVEPGLRAALEGALVVGLRERGVRGGGPSLRVTVIAVDHRPEAAVPGGGGAVAWTGRTVLRAEVPDRPGCTVEVEARRTWTLPPGGALSSIDARAAAVDLLAVEAADRVVDAVLGTPACR